MGYGSGKASYGEIERKKLEPEQPGASAGVSKNLGRGVTKRPRLQSGDSRFFGYGWQMDPGSESGTGG